MNRFLRAEFTFVLFGGLLGLVASVADFLPKTLPLLVWVLFTTAFVVLGGLPQWHRK